MNLYLCLSTLHMGCTFFKDGDILQICPLPQHTSYGLHRVSLLFFDCSMCFASAHFIWAAPAKLHRDMDTAL